MTRDPARQVALEVLTKVRERNAYAHETLDTVLKRRRLEGRDAAFATRLAYGALATRGTLDEAVLRCARPGTHLSPIVADALALGAYEILFAGTPPHAAVSVTVELVRSVEPRAAGLANAVMRRVSEAKSEFPWGDPATDVAALARLYGHPEWLARLWVDELGHERAAEVMRADNLPAPLFLARLSSDRPFDSIAATLTEDGLDPVAGPLPDSWVAGNPSAVRTSRAVADSEVLVMDAGAQFAAHAVRPLPASTIVEIGAGRGSKSLLMAGLARTHGASASSITAVDIHAFKLEVLRRSASALGFKEIAAVQTDAAHAQADLGVGAESADAVLIDAPCSGLGTLRRHPDRRWRALPEEIEALAALGQRLLERGAALVRPGGFMVYSTCTIARRENAEVVERFLAGPAGGGFVIDNIEPDVPLEWRGFVSENGWFQSLPQEGGVDGHFVARLVRETAS